MNPKNLYEYYTAMGKPLPSVQQRKSIAASAGISNYTGSAQQNNQLLGYLMQNQPPKQNPTPTPTPSTTNPPAPTQPTSTSPTGDGFTGNNAIDILQNYYGVDPALLAKFPAELWNKDFGPVATYIQQQATQGKQMDEINTSNFFDAYTAASNDPTIQATYGDQLKLDKSGLFQNLNYLNTLYGVDQATQERNFRKQQENLKENAAQGGQAYSGFRNMAQKDLNQEQQGVIQSKRAELKNNVFKTGSALEAAYGTNGLDQFGNIRIGDETYNPIGGITGSVPLNKEQDIIKKQGDIYAMMTYPTK